MKSGLLALVVLALVTMACVPETEVKKREQAAYSQGWYAGETSGRKEAEQVCKNEKLEMQTAHNNELKTAVDNAVTETQIENTKTIAGGFLGGVIVSAVVVIFVLLLSVIGVLFVMFRKRDDFAFNEFLDSLKS